MSGSRARSLWINVLKLVLVGLLMAYVLGKVTWTDTLVRLTGEGDQIQKVELATGEVVGDWEVPDDAVLEFRPHMEDGSLGVAQVVQRTPDAQGAREAVEIGFLTYWRHLDIGWFLLGAACYILTAFLAGTRWWWLLKVNGLGVSMVEAWRLTWIGVFFNNVVLGSTGGDVVKAFYIMKRSPGQRVPALVSVVVDRVMGLGSLALLCGVAVLFMLEEFAWIAVAVWALILGVAMLGVVAFSKRVRKAIRLNELVEKLPFSGVLKRVDEAVYYYRDHKAGLFGWLMFGVFNHIVSVLAVICMGVALGVDMSIPAYFVIVPVVNIVSAAPIGPNGWGVGEFVYGEMFARYGGAATEAVRRTQGVCLSLLFRLHMTLVSVLGGIVLLFEKDRVTREDVDEQMAKEEEEEVRAGF